MNQKILRIKLKLEDRCTSSSVHGLPNIYSRRNTFLRVLWSICLLKSIGFCSFMIAQSLSSYLERNVVTTIRFVYESSIVFPTVTICNSNPFVTNFSNQFMKDYFNNSHFEFNDYQRIDNLAKSSKIDDETRKKFGYDSNTSIIDMFFMQGKIENEELEWYYEVGHGNCFKFNSGFDAYGNKTPIRSISLDGIDNGLSFVYFSGLSDETKLLLYGNYGSHIFIHNNSYDPLTFEGIELKPGTYNIIFINKIISRKQPYPFSECQNLDNFDSELFNHLKNSKKSYRRRECYDLCIQRQINKKCGCNHLIYPQFRNLSPCITNVQDACKDDVIRSVSERLHEVCSPECPLECESVSYGFTISSSKYPSKEHSYLRKFNTHIIGRNMTHQQVQDSFLAVDINFDELKYTLIEEFPSISVLQLISNIGGTLGLFLGMSILSLMEVLELIAELFYIAFCNK